MSTIDLERLRIRQKYYLSIRKEKLEEVVLEQLSITDPPLSGFASWLSKAHGKLIEFELSPLYMYILQTGKNFTPEEVQNLKANYDKLDKSGRLKAVLGRRDCLPHEVYINITRENEEGCEVEVECLPTLYRRISQLNVRDVSAVEIQDAYINCERFLQTIFKGGLNGTTMSETKLIVPTPKAELLINDVMTRQITEKIQQMLDSATGEVLVISWMGTFFLDKLKELKQKGVQIKIITGNIGAIRQDSMQKEKELAIKELLPLLGKNNISIRKEFHGRAVIVDNKALIGSPDLDSYSLTGARIEFATYTEDPAIVRTLRNYFKQIFIPLKENKIPPAE
jgi:HKD family nuclease